MRATFIRHGQSTENARVPCDDLGSIELRKLDQPREFAANRTQAPTLTATSSYISFVPLPSKYPELNPVKISGRLVISRGVSRRSNAVDRTWS